MRIYLSLFIVTTLLSFSSSIFAQENSEAMKTWMDYMTPGQEHKMMASMSGEWTEVTKFWMAPGSEPQVTEGTANFEMILGGRYMQGKHKGQMMGMPFEGMSLDAFDNGKKEHTSIWVDNMGTGIMVSKGQYDEKSKTLKMTGLMYDPTVKKDLPMRDEISWDGNDRMIHKMFATMDGKEFQNMEITLTRKK
jgi:hypothetical protein